MKLFIIQLNTHQVVLNIKKNILKMICKHNNCTTPKYFVSLFYIITYCPPYLRNDAIPTHTRKFNVSCGHGAAWGNLRTQIRQLALVGFDVRIER